VTGMSLFMQCSPRCGKTEAVRHFSFNCSQYSRTYVLSVSCSYETTIEQFVGSIAKEYFPAESLFDFIHSLVENVHIIWYLRDVRLFLRQVNDFLNLI
jgi:hypothetical protein